MWILSQEGRLVNLSRAVAIGCDQAAGDGVWSLWARWEMSTEILCVGSEEQCRRALQRLADDLTARPCGQLTAVPGAAARPS